MYIIELFINWLNKNKRGQSVNPDKIYQGNTKNLNSDNDTDDALNCEHNFMPVDSTGLILACTKCGFVVKKKETEYSDNDKIS